jgi:hypothetical protein
VTERNHNSLQTKQITAESVEVGLAGKLLVKAGERAGPRRGLPLMSFDVTELLGVCTAS